MSVQLDPPHSLGFRRPLTQTVKRTLSVGNTNAHPVAFKVKTTAPKLYCVRPNSGRIEPGETVEVQVMLQAMKEEPPLSAKCKDKFLIQSTYITPEKETLPLQDIWNTTNDANEETKVHQQKVKVLYLAAEGTIDEEDEALANQSSMIGNGDFNKYDTVRPFPPTDTNGHASGGIPDFHGEPEHDLRPVTPHEDAREEPEPVRAPTPAPAIPTITVVPVNVPAEPAVPVAEHDALATKYAEAQAELQRMRALLQSMPDPSLGVAPPPSVVATPTELRRRTRGLSDASSTMAGTYAGGGAPASDIASTLTDERLQAPEGVPLQIVIAIALGVFVTTYLFF